VVMFGGILDCERDLNERIKRLPTRPLEILPGLERDLVIPRLKRAVGREEVHAPSVHIRDGGSDPDPYPRVS